MPVSQSTKDFVSLRRFDVRFRVCVCVRATRSCASKSILHSLGLVLLLLSLAALFTFTFVSFAFHRPLSSGSSSCFIPFRTCLFLSCSYPHCFFHSCLFSPFLPPRLGPPHLGPIFQPFVPVLASFSHRMHASLCLSSLSHECPTALTS